MDETPMLRVNDGTTAIAVDDQPQLEEVSILGHLARYLIGLLLFFLTPFVSWHTVNPKEALVITCWGKLWKVLKSPGLYFIIPFGCQFARIETKHVTIDMEQYAGKTVIADLNGNPVVVGGVLSYNIVDPVAAHFNVMNVNEYIRVNAQSVLKSVVSRYPYESRSEDIPSLKNHSHEISLELRAALAQKVTIAGVNIQSFELSDLYYSPEIAPAMLIRQQAQAKVDARELIVNGAVHIVGGAIDGLHKAGVRVSEEEASKLAANLLCVICSEGQVQNTLPLQ